MSVWLTWINGNFHGAHAYVYYDNLIVFISYHAVFGFNKIDEFDIH